MSIYTNVHGTVRPRHRAVDELNYGEVFQHPVSKRYGVKIIGGILLQEPDGDWFFESGVGHWRDFVVDLIPGHVTINICLEATPENANV